MAEGSALRDKLALTRLFAVGNTRIAFATAAVFLRVSGRGLQRPPARIDAEMKRMQEVGTVDIAYLDPRLHGFVRAQGA